MAAGDGRDGRNVQILLPPEAAFAEILVEHEACKMLDEKEESYYQTIWKTVNFIYTPFSWRFTLAY